jgi:hypothetical protein
MSSNKDATKQQEEVGGGSSYCNPYLLRRLRLGGLQFQVTLGKKVCKTPSQQKTGGCGDTCLSSQLWWEIQNRKIVVQAILGKKKSDPSSKITTAKKGWRCGKASA